MSLPASPKNREAEPLKRGRPTDEELAQRPPLQSAELALDPTAILAMIMPCCGRACTPTVRKRYKDHILVTCKCCGATVKYIPPQVQMVTIKAGTEPGTADKS